MGKGKATNRTASCLGLGPAFATAGAAAVAVAAVEVAAVENAAVAIAAVGVAAAEVEAVGAGAAGVAAADYTNFVAAVDLVVLVIAVAQGGKKMLQKQDFHLAAVVATVSLLVVMY